MMFILLKVFWSGFKDRRTSKSQELIRWSVRLWMSVNSVELAGVFFSPSQQEKLCFFSPLPISLSSHPALQGDRQHQSTLAGVAVPKKAVNEKPEEELYSIRRTKATHALFAAAS
jgi:hypothetical protein